MIIIDGNKARYIKNIKIDSYSPSNNNLCGSCFCKSYTNKSNFGFISNLYNYQYNFNNIINCLYKNNFPNFWQT